MPIDKSKQWWTGDPEDLAQYLEEYGASNAQHVDRVVRANCSACDSVAFSVRVDDTEGCAERTCLACGLVVLMLDSDDSVEDADLESAACPCGGEVFNVATGYELRADGEVSWVYVGLRCVTDGVLGCYTDWSIDYSPSAHLLGKA